MSFNKLVLDYSLTESVDSLINLFIAMCRMAGREHHRCGKDGERHVLCRAFQLSSYPYHHLPGLATTSKPAQRLTCERPPDRLIDSVFLFVNKFGYEISTSKAIELDNDMKCEA